jgi:4-hydroxy-tetrahydrodipicolinate reductase
MRIALFGYGKMGKEIEALAIQRNHKIVLKVNSKSASDIDLSNTDVAIEFSQPQHAVENILTCFDQDTPVVIGTTGWLEKLEYIKSLTKEKNQSCFYASNFSVGVNIFFEINRKLAKIMNTRSEYDVTLEEIHHIHKLDAPSGTAITLANDIINNLDRKEKWINSSSQDNKVIEITSVRTENVPGTHVVKYSSEIDDIELKHTANNRKGFALGALMAAEFIQDKKGFYGMPDILQIG